MDAVKTIDYINEEQQEFTLLESIAEKRRYRLGYRIVKRFYDVLLSMIALIILSPVFLITAIAVYTEDHGKVIYKQERIGKKGKVFYIYKFRSMRMDADKIHEQMKMEYGDEEVSFKLKDDPRVTNIGKIIRKYNIDELPQLINIIKGEMSIVGPRPLPVYEYKEERQRYGDKYTARYSVPQGLTCYWQVSNRADVSFEQRMQMDINFVMTCSLKNDFILIFKTALAVVTGKASY